MAEERKHEEKPWYPKIEGEPLLNPFANPQDGLPEHPVELQGVEEEESLEEGEAPAGTAGTDEPGAAVKPAE